MAVSKHIKERIVKLILQDVSTEDIAEITNCSIGTVRMTYEELRDEYGVNSKVGIARAYLQKELIELNNHVKSVLNLLGSCQMTTTKKGRPCLQKKPKKRKN